MSCGWEGVIIVDTSANECSYFSFFIINNKYNIIQLFYSFISHSQRTLKAKVNIYVKWQKNTILFKNVILSLSLLLE